MAVNISVTQTFVVNGKECASLEELPQDVREACLQAMSDGRDGETGTSHTAAVVFNGTEYENRRQMPPQVRLAFDAALSWASRPLETRLTGTASGTGESKARSWPRLPLMVLLGLVLAALLGLVLAPFLAMSL